MPENQEVHQAGKLPENQAGVRGLIIRQGRYFKTKHGGRRVTAQPGRETGRVMCTEEHRHYSSQKQAQPHAHTVMGSDNSPAPTLISLKVDLALGGGVEYLCLILAVPAVMLIII